MTNLKDTLWPILEELGETEVRSRLLAAWGESKRPYVEEWLRLKDQARDDALNREQMDIARDAAASARDAADSARVTAREARKANKIATAAIIIATGSMIVAIIF